MPIVLKEYDPKNFIDPNQTKVQTAEENKNLEIHRLDPLKRLTGSLEGEQGLANYIDKVESEYNVSLEQDQERKDNLEQHLNSTLPKADEMANMVKSLNKTIGNFKDIKDVKEQYTKKFRERNLNKNNKLFLETVLNDIIRPLSTISREIEQYKTQLRNPAISEADKQTFRKLLEDKINEEKSLQANYRLLKDKPNTLVNLILKKLENDRTNEINHLKTLIDEFTKDAPNYLQELENKKNQIERIKLLGNTNHSELTTVEFKEMTGKELNSLIRAIDNRIGSMDNADPTKIMLISAKETLEATKTLGLQTYHATLVVTKDEESEINKVILDAQSNLHLNATEKQNTSNTIEIETQPEAVQKSKKGLLRRIGDGLKAAANFMKQLFSKAQRGSDSSQTRQDLPKVANESITTTVVEMAESTPAKKPAPKEVTPNEFISHIVGVLNQSGKNDNATSILKTFLNSTALSEKSDFDKMTEIRRKLAEYRASNDFKSYPETDAIKSVIERLHVEAIKWQSKYTYMQQNSNQDSSNSFGSEHQRHFTPGLNNLRKSSENWKGENNRNSANLEQDTSAKKTAPGKPS